MVTKNHDVLLHWNFSIAIFVSLVKEFLDSFGLPSVFETLADHESRHDIKSTSDGTNGARLTVGIHHWRRERGAEDDSYTPMKTEKVPLQLERRYRIELGRYFSSSVLLYYTRRSELRRTFPTWIVTRLISPMRGLRRPTLFENYSKCRIWIFEFWHFNQFLSY